MRPFRKAKRSLGWRRYRNEVATGRQLAEVHFGELEGIRFPTSRKEARAYIAEAGTLFAGFMERFVAREIGLPDVSIIETQVSVFRDSFAHTLEPLLFVHLGEGSGADEATKRPRPLPVGTLLLDDLKAGPRVQAQMWAESHVRSASETLRSLGATDQMNLIELRAIDVESFAELVLAHVILGLVAPTNDIIESVPEHRRDEVQEAFSLVEADFRILEHLPQHLEIPEARDIKITGETGQEGDLADVMDNLRLLFQTTFAEPLLQCGGLSYTEIMERVYLPLRIQRGARWSPERGVYGTPTTLELDDELKKGRTNPPIYFPFVLTPTTSRPADASGSGGYLSAPDDYLYVNDPRMAFARRIEQLIWLQEFGYWRG